MADVAEKRDSTRKSPSSRCPLENVQVGFLLLGEHGDRMAGQIAKMGLAASAVSIVASVYIYFMHGDGGDTELGIFVGLWAPTLILFSQEIDKMME